MWEFQAIVIQKLKRGQNFLLSSACFIFCKWWAFSETAKNAKNKQKLIQRDNQKGCLPVGPKIRKIESEVK